MPQLIIAAVALLLTCWGIVGLSLESAPAALKAPVAHAQTGTTGALLTPADTPPSCAVKSCLALTFDDGPDAIRTPQILDTLARHHARATFFVVGMHVPGNEALLRRMHVEGHEIGNHSWSHPDMRTLSADQIHQQIYGTQAVIAAAGVPVPSLFRPPYGAMNDYVAANVPLTIVQWNIDPEDWRYRKHSQEIVAHMGSYAKPGGVVVMHDTQQSTVEALGPLLAELEHTYQFVTVSEQFHLAPGQPGTFYGH